jgi:outer membrane lipoprotein-sorting protein
MVPLRHALNQPCAPAHCPALAGLAYKRRMLRRSVLRFSSLALPALANAPAWGQARPAPATAPMLPAADLARIEDYLNAITTLKARFLQVDQRGQVAQGTLWISRPGRMRFEYDPPSPILLVADGTSVTFHDRQLDQTSVLLISMTPLGILLAPRIRLVGGEVSVTRGESFGASLEITTVRTASPREGSLVLTFNANPVALRQWRVIDAQAQEVRVSLSAVETGGRFDPALFRPPQRGAGSVGGSGG